jgi:hypothetical protein
MDNFQLWKLAADVALLLSVLYLCVRFVRSQGSSINTRELRDLEIVLKNLLKDADVASRSLTESLGRRQNALERLLSDLDGGERRLSVSIQAAEERSTLLSRMLSQASSSSVARSSMELEEQTAPVRAQTVQSNPVRGNRSTIIPDTQRIELVNEVNDEPWAEPPSFGSRTAPANAAMSRRNINPEEMLSDEDAPEQPRRTGAAAYRTVASQKAAASGTSSAQYNVFGERLDSSESSVTPASAPRSNPLPRQPLANDIEVERVRPKPSQPTIRRRDQTEMQDIYEAAERLLRAGEDVETVAAATRLPLDEVRKVSQIMISSDKASRSDEGIESAQINSAVVKDPAADPRLGVFASIRRQTQVL